MSTIIIRKQCIVCDKPSEVEVDEDKWSVYWRGKIDGAPAATHSVQVIFPELSAEDREIIISGTHPACWKELFGDGEA